VWCLWIGDCSVLVVGFAYFVLCAGFGLYIGGYGCFALFVFSFGFIVGCSLLCVVFFCVFVYVFVYFVFAVLFSV